MKTEEFIEMLERIKVRVGISIETIQGQYGEPGYQKAVVDYVTVMVPTGVEPEYRDTIYTEVNIEIED